MDWIKEAARRLDVYEKYEYTLIYSGRIKGFRGSVRKKCKELKFVLSKNWKDVSKEIKIGLVQELFERILKLERRKTMNKDLYHSFIKNAHIAIPKTKTNPVLESAFDKLNQKFFDNLLEKPNFTLSSARNTLGCYEYGTDTITITEHLLEHPQLMEYVLYHEMLHKKHKFSSGRERSRHHSKAFKEDEKKFPNSEYHEKELNKIAREFSRRKFLFRWFK